MSVNNRVFSTGDIAKYLDVHFRTVIRWIEKGSLSAYKLPGRGNNRIEEREFLRFLKAQGIPVPAELQPPSRRILIVDDEAAMAAAIARPLKLAGYETETAADGFQAGEKLASLQPALMTLDLQMPRMDGFSVLEFVRGQSRYRDLKILVISGLDEGVLARAEAAGADASLGKPFDNKELRVRVEELIGVAARTGQA